MSTHIFNWIENENFERMNDELNFEKILHENKINFNFLQQIKDHSHIVFHHFHFLINIRYYTHSNEMSKVDLLSVVRWLSSWFVIFFNVTRNKKNACANVKTKKL